MDARLGVNPFCQQPFSFAMQLQHLHTSLGGKTTTQKARLRGHSALCLSDLGCFAWSKVSSADLHVVESSLG
jgi:hypothetical protein